MKGTGNWSVWYHGVRWTRRVDVERPEGQARTSHKEFVFHWKFVGKPLKG